MLFLAIFSLFYTLISASNVINQWTDDQLARLDETGAEINRLVLVYADWCGACRHFKPKLNQIVPKLVQLSPSPLEIIQINLDKAPLIGSRLRISHLPSLFHQIDGEFRKLDSYKDTLDKYFEGKLWIGTPTMGPLSPPRGRTTPSAPNKKSTAAITELIESLGISVPIFLFLSLTVVLFIALFVIWCVWIYTDYKLNAHNFTDEAIKERIKFLRTQPEFKDEFDISDSEEETDSGEESDTEPESSDLRGRRSSLKNRLK